MGKIFNISTYVSLLFFVISFSNSSANNNEIEVKLVFHESIIQHSGGTDKCGCHTNRKTGEYHCHNRKQEVGIVHPKRGYSRRE